MLSKGFDQNLHVLIKNEFTNDGLELNNGQVSINSENPKPPLRNHRYFNRKIQLLIVTKPRIFF